MRNKLASLRDMLRVPISLYFEQHLAGCILPPLHSSVRASTAPDLLDELVNHVVWEYVRVFIRVPSPSDFRTQTFDALKEMLKFVRNLCDDRM